MVDHSVHGRIFRIDKPRDIRNAHHPAGPGQRPELIVGQAAPVVTHGKGRGVGHRHRERRPFQHLVERLVVNMGQVRDDSQPVAFLQNGLSEVRQPAGAPAFPFAVFRRTWSERTPAALQQGRVVATLAVGDSDAPNAQAVVETQCIHFAFQPTSGAFDRKQDADFTGLSRPFDVP